MVVDTGSRAQEPPSEAASPSSLDSFILLPAPTEAPSPLTGYLPYLQADPTRAAGAPRGSQEPPSSGAPYLAEATLQPPLPSSAQVPEYPLQGCEPAGPADQPPVPPRHILDTARLLSPCNISAEGRILRAWRAGQAAGKVLRGELDFVDATPHLSLSNRIYCVLRTASVTEPRVLHSFAAYKQVPGILQRRGSVSHAFPSETEARAYFAGAQVPYPQ